MEVCDVLDRWLLDAAPAVLATVIGVEGHAYRKPGAAMLIYADGRRIGTISPGCLEADLQERAPGLFAEGRCEIVSYNMKPEEDAMWGEAVGCGGVVDVLLEPLAGAAEAAVREASEKLRAGDDVMLLRYRKDASIEYRVALAASPEAGVKINGASFYFLKCCLLVPACSCLAPGYDAEPVARLARSLGFSVTVSDWRPGLLSGERFAGAELVCGLPAEVASALRVGPKDYALVMGHQLQRDRALLEALLPAAPAYVGVVGSSKRIAHLFDGLPMPSFVHAPVGLAIGAEGPEEIAVSIAAELVAVRRKRKGGEAYGGIKDRGYLSGGRPEQQDGPAEAVPGVCGW